MPSTAVVRYNGRTARRARYASNAVAVVRAGRALVKGVAKYRNRARAQRNGGIAESGVTHSTHNLSTLYRKRRVPKRKYKRAIKSRRNFLAQFAAVQNASSTIANGTFPFTTNVSVQGWWSLDLLKAADARQLLESQLPTGSTFAQYIDQRLYIKSFTMNCDIVNTSTTNGVKLDLYWCVPRNDIPEAVIPTLGSNGNDVATAIYAWYGSTGTHTLADPKGDPKFINETPNVTPFQFAGFCRLFKIVQAKRVTLIPGGTFTATYRVKGRYIDYKDLENQHHKRGLTKTLLVRQIGLSSAANNYEPSAVRVTFSENQTSKVINLRPSTQGVVGSA